MKINEDNFCVILAGGRGRRLWPSSRMELPKQFIDFFGVGRTQLQQTFDRFVKILPKENILICTNKEYAPLVRQQLPELHEENLMIEPIYRGTAPSVAWADMRVCRRNHEGYIVVTPSDQFVQNEEAFYANIEEAFNFIRHHDIGDPSDTDGIYQIQSFTEKPEREFAKMFMESGEFLWNTGLLFANARYLHDCFRKLFPEVLNQFDTSSFNYTIEQEMAFVDENYPSYPKLSIDQCVLERGSNDGDNVVIDSEVMLEDAHNNVIKLPKGKLGVINGLDGYIVAEEGNVLFICKKGDSSAMVRKYVSEVQIKYGDDFV